MHSTKLAFAAVGADYVRGMGQYLDILVVLVTSEAVLLAPQEEIRRLAQLHAELHSQRGHSTALGLDAPALSKFAEVAERQYMYMLYTVCTVLRYFLSLFKRWVLITMYSKDLSPPSRATLPLTGLRDMSRSTSAAPMKLTIKPLKSKPKARTMPSHGHDPFCTEANSSYHVPWP